MPLITASWTEPDDDGIQTAEYGGFTLRVYPADTPPPGAAQLSWFGDQPRPGFAWEIIGAENGRWDSGWITTRAAARTEALGKAFLRHNPDVPALGNRPVNSPPTAKVTCRAKKTTA